MPRFEPRFDFDRRSEPSLEMRRITIRIDAHDVGWEIDLDDYSKQKSVALIAQPTEDASVIYDRVRANLVRSIDELLEEDKEIIMGWDRGERKLDEKREEWREQNEKFR